MFWLGTFPGPSVFCFFFCLLKNKQKTTHKYFNGLHLQLTEASWLKLLLTCMTKILFNYCLSMLGSLVRSLWEKFVCWSFIRGKHVESSKENRIVQREELNWIQSHWRPWSILQGASARVPGLYTYISVAEYPQGKGMPLGESAPLSEGQFPERDSLVSQQHPTLSGGGGVTILKRTG